MATVPAKQASPQETLEQRFNRLAEEWYNAAGYLSSMTQASQHPAYQEIIRMGDAVVPLLLRDLEATHRHWFIALKEITKENPMPRESAGNIPQLAEAWVLWGKAKGYQW